MKSEYISGIPKVFVLSFQNKILRRYGRHVHTMYLKSKVVENNCNIHRHNLIVDNIAQ